MSAQPLTRAALGEDHDGAARPPRIVHLGIGHFFRAHQAWYTARATDAQEWGIAAFTGRSPRMAEVLTAQEGLYTLVERGPQTDSVEVVDSIVEARAGTDVERLVTLLREPTVAVVTLTITESGYRLKPDGAPDLTDADLTADLEVLSGRSTSTPTTALGRLLGALDARRQAGAGPIAVVPCDNIPGNGEFVRTGLTALAEQVSPELASWVAGNVSFVSTSVDRITPHEEVDPAVLAEAGWIDEVPVVTEPFSDWVLQGDFPAGRPAWESAGARFVEDIDGWENRKLWLLNGAHSLLVFAGQRRGAATVAEAMQDATCRALVEEFWAEAVQCLPPEIEHIDYRAALVERFENPRIVHRLQQIAAESTVKVAFRHAAVAERTVAAGRTPTGTVRALAEWIAWAQAGPTAVDARAEEVRAAVAEPDPVAALVGVVSPTLAANPEFLQRVREARTALSADQA